jgi:predicted nucleic acid-binding protein
MGTLGILEVAAARGMISLPTVLNKLRATSCFLADELIEAALERDNARRRP